MISCADKSIDKLLSMSVITNGLIQSKEVHAMSVYLGRNRAVPWVEWCPTGLCLCVCVFFFVCVCVLVLETKKKETSQKKKPLW